MRGTSASTNLRIVYDASNPIKPIKPNKALPSLNQCLLKGPSLNPLIIDLLLRFRLHHSAFICDIKKSIFTNSHKGDGCITVSVGRRSVF